MNDKLIGLEKAKRAWRSMIEDAKAQHVKVILMTPTWDITQRATYTGEDKKNLFEHTHQIRSLAGEYELGLVDSYELFADAAKHQDMTNLLSAANHPSRLGHDLVSEAILSWFLWA